MHRVCLLERVAWSTQSLQKASKSLSEHWWWKWWWLLLHKSSVSVVKWSSAWLTDWLNDWPLTSVVDLLMSFAIFCFWVIHYWYVFCTKFILIAIDITQFFLLKVIIWFYIGVNLKLRHNRKRRQYKVWLAVSSKANTVLQRPLVVLLIFVLVWIVLFQVVIFLHFTAKQC